MLAIRRSQASVPHMPDPSPDRVVLERAFSLKILAKSNMHITRMQGKEAIYLLRHPERSQKKN